MNHIYDDPRIPQVAKNLADKTVNSTDNENSWSAVLTPKYSPAFWSCVISKFAEQLSGINFIWFFSTTFFDNVSGNGKTVTLLVSVFNLFGTFVGIYAVNNFPIMAGMKYGVMLQGGLLVLLYFSIQIQAFWIGPVIVGCYMIASAGGISGLIGLYITEILPPKGISLAIALGWLLIAAIGKLSMIGVQIFGGNNMLLIFAIFCGIGYYAMDRYCVKGKSSIADRTDATDEKMIPLISRVE